MLFAILLVISVALNVYQYTSKKREEKKPKELSIDARQMMHDLTRGGAVVRVEVLDPTGLLYYRSRA